uniref:EF-hand domain-containing protein n=1 Tax=Strigamia maritima TaxID=126957 RepID=T1JJY8_STRMM
MCKKLNMEEDVEEIMHQLGFDEGGRISIQGICSLSLPTKKRNKCASRYFMR